MKIVYLWSIFMISVYAQSILVINSNSKIDRYKSMEQAFSKSIDKPFKTINIAKMSPSAIQEYLYDEYPDMIYTIGTKAYQYAKKYVPEKKIFFSSIVNYKRFKMEKKSFGVSNELHPGMKLTLIKSLLPHTTSLSMLYSHYTEDVYKSFKEEAKHVGIEVIGVKIKQGGSFNIGVLQKADAFVMIADPILLKEEAKIKNLYKIMATKNKPIIAYHKLYLKYGAMLILAVDTPTIGRQVASMMKQEMQGYAFTHIQLPAGSQVIFHKGLAQRMGISCDRSALGIVNKVIK